MTDDFLIDMLDELQIRCQICQQGGLERGNFNDHISKGCLKVNIACPSADIKCLWTGSLDQIDKHLTRCIFNPLRPLITELHEHSSAQQDQIDKLKKEVNGQEARINALQHETRQLKTEVNRQQSQMKLLESKRIHMVF
jgi:hypothetical protein